MFAGAGRGGQEFSTRAGLIVQLLVRKNKVMESVCVLPALLCLFMRNYYDEYACFALY